MLLSLLLLLLPPLPLRWYLLYWEARCGADRGAFLRPLRRSMSSVRLSVARANDGWVGVQNESLATKVSARLVQLYSHLVYGSLNGFPSHV